jgi:MFS family permease
MTTHDVAPRGANGGLAIFGLIWFGQLVSLIGSGLTEFALGVWVFQRTGAATDYALTAFFITLPHVVAAPFAGALVDRWDRRRVMLLSDCGAALSSLAVALLAWSGRLEVWHVYGAVLVTSTCATFQFPAYATLVTQLVPKQHLGRANGMVETASAVGWIASPLLAGLLMGAISLSGIILLDAATFLVGVSLLLVARVPKREAGDARDVPSGSLFRQAASGWTYIAARPGLRGLLTFFVIVNFSVGLFNALFVPLVLSFAPTAVLGTLVAIGTSGLLVGGLLMTAWGGPRRRVNGILGLGLPFGLCILAIGLQPFAPLIAVAAFLYYLCQPVINASDQAIWQSKVAFDVQGRVFATRRAIEHAAALLAYLVAGPLADRLFSPLLAADGALAASLGPLVGVGPGRGIGLLFVLMGLVALLATAWGYTSPRVRRIEDELPDTLVEEAPPLAGATDPQPTGQFAPAA